VYASRPSRSFFREAEDKCTKEGIALSLSGQSLTWLKREGMTENEGKDSSDSAASPDTTGHVVGKEETETQDNANDAGTIREETNGPDSRPLASPSNMPDDQEELEVELSDGDGEEQQGVVFVVLYLCCIIYVCMLA
jgi:hypothetical protein